MRLRSTYFQTYTFSFLVYLGLVPPTKSLRFPHIRVNLSEENLHMKVNISVAIPCDSFHDISAETDAGGNKVIRGHLPVFLPFIHSFYLQANEWSSNKRPMNLGRKERAEDSLSSSLSPSARSNEPPLLSGRFSSLQCLFPPPILPIRAFLHFSPYLPFSKTLSRRGGITPPLPYERSRRRRKQKKVFEIHEKPVDPCHMGGAEGGNRKGNKH